MEAIPATPVIDEVDDPSTLWVFGATFSAMLTRQVTLASAPLRWAFRKVRAGQAGDLLSMIAVCYTMCSVLLGMTPVEVAIYLYAYAAFGGHLMWQSASALLARVPLYPAPYVKINCTEGNELVAQGQLCWIEDSGKYPTFEEWCKPPFEANRTYPAPYDAKMACTSPNYGAWLAHLVGVLQPTALWLVSTFGVRIVAVGAWFGATFVWSLLRTIPWLLVKVRRIKQPSGWVHVIEPNLYYVPNPVMKGLWSACRTVTLERDYRKGDVIYVAVSDAPNQVADTLGPEASQPGSMLMNVSTLPRFSAFWLGTTDARVIGGGFQMGAFFIMPIHVYAALKDYKASGGKIDMIVNGRAYVGVDPLSWPVHRWCDQDAIALVTPAGVRATTSLTTAKFSQVKGQRVHIVAAGYVAGQPMRSVGEALAKLDDTCHKPIHTASTQGGWSGAPLLDLKGGVVGMHLGAAEGGNYYLPRSLLKVLTSSRQGPESDDSYSGADDKWEEAEAFRHTLREMEEERREAAAQNWADRNIRDQAEAYLRVNVFDKRGAIASALINQAGGARWADLEDEDDELRHEVTELVREWERGAGEGLDLNTYINQAMWHGGEAGTGRTLAPAPKLRDDDNYSPAFLRTASVDYAARVYEACMALMIRRPPPPKDDPNYKRLRENVERTRAAAHARLLSVRGIWGSVPAANGQYYRLPAKGSAAERDLLVALTEVPGGNRVRVPPEVLQRVQDYTNTLQTLTSTSVSDPKEVPAPSRGGSELKAASEAATPPPTTREETTPPPIPPVRPVPRPLETSSSFQATAPSTGPIDLTNSTSVGTKSSGPSPQPSAFKPAPRTQSQAGVASGASTHTSSAELHPAVIEFLKATSTNEMKRLRSSVLFGYSGETGPKPADSRGPPAQQKQ